MNISLEEINLIKEKTSLYLTKSIHKLSYILGKDPEQVMSTTSLEELLDGDASPMQKDAITSLYNQVTALKKLN
jgi:hypothetical protein